MEAEVCLAEHQINAAGHTHCVPKMTASVCALPSQAAPSQPHAEQLPHTPARDAHQRRTAGAAGEHRHPRRVPRDMHRHTHHEAEVADVLYHIRRGAGGWWHWIVQKIVARGHAARGPPQRALEQQGGELLLGNGGGVSQKTRPHSAGTHTYMCRVASLYHCSCFCGGARRAALDAHTQTGVSQQ